MKIVLPHTSIYVTFNFFDPNLSSNEPAEYKFTSKTVFDVLLSVREETEKQLKKLNIEPETPGAIVISFNEDKTRLVSSKSSYGENPVDTAVLKFISGELLPALNSENYANHTPLVLFPFVASDTNLFSQVALSLDEALEYVKTFQELSEKNQGTAVPLMEEYVSRYNLTPYSVVVMWGLTLRGLIRDKLVSYSDNVVPGVVEYAANMVHPGLWGSRAEQFDSADRALTAELIFNKIHELAEAALVETESETDASAETTTEVSAERQYLLPVVN